MGWVGTPCDGMGAHQQKPRIPCVLAPVWRTRRTVPGNGSRVVLQLAFRGSVPGMGLADPVPPQRRDGWGRTVDQAGNSGDPSIPEGDGGEPRRARAGAGGSEASTQAGAADGAAADARTGAWLYRQCFHLFLRDRCAWNAA